MTQQYCIKKAALSGAITIPPSKSQTLRALLFATLSHGKSVIHHPLASPDTEAMVHACRLFGANVAVSSTKIEIEGTKGIIQSTEDVIHAGNSGIVLRFCSAVGALAPLPVVITGDRSIRHQRPMRPLLDGLSQLGVSALSMRGDGYAPVIIKGPLRGGKACINGEDSQPVSALLIAAAFADAPIELTVLNPGEKPWVSLTLYWLNKLGIPYENDGFTHYKLKGQASYGGFSYAVPGDLSSVAFPIVAALITQSELTINNVDMNDPQGDRELIPLLQRMGAIIEIDNASRSLHIKKSPTLTGIDIDINPYIDAITILTVLACFAQGDTRIYNGSIARHKECNRIACIIQELSKMGADIRETEDGLIIHPSPLKGAEVWSHGDHRMAMSLAVAALGAEGETVLSGGECVIKTFPSFFSDFNALGAEIR